MHETASTPSLPAAVFFDFDGVLVDSERLHCATLHAVLRDYLAENGAPLPSVAPEDDWVDYQQHIMGLDDRDAFRRLAAQAGIPLEADMLAALIDRKAALFARLAAEGQVEEIPGSAAFVRACAKRAPVALCSGALKSDILPLLEQLGLSDAFRVLVTAEDTPKSKPAPEPYLLALKKMAKSLGLEKLEASQCAAIEDTPEGIQSATAAGIPVLGLCTLHKPEALLAAGAVDAVSTLDGLTPEELFARTRPERGVRLQKVMAAAGIGSRRYCEELITAGRVKVDGRTITQLGTRVRPGQNVEVDGTSIHAEPHKYYMVDKPRDVLCTSSDPRGRPTLLEWARRHGADPALRLYTIGRLDGDSEGLILLTNDGALAQRLAHPKHHTEKEYRVWVHRPLTPEDIQRLRHGIRDHGELLRALRAVNEPAPPDPHGVCTIRLTLGEGKNRHIRRQMDALGIHVIRLRRIRIGAFQEGQMNGRPIRELRPADLQKIRPDTKG